MPEPSLGEAGFFAGPVEPLPPAQSVAVGDENGIPLPQNDLIQHTAFAVPQVGEGAAVVVELHLIILQVQAPSGFFHQDKQEGRCLRPVALGDTVSETHLRGVNPQQADAPPIGEDQSIAVYNAIYLLPIIDSGGSGAGGKDEKRRSDKSKPSTVHCHDHSSDISHSRGGDRLRSISV